MKRSKYKLQLWASAHNAWCDVPTAVIKLTYQEYLWLSLVTDSWYRWVEC